MRRRAEQAARPRGSRARRARSCGRARRRRPTRPRRSRTAGPARPASSAPTRRGSTSRSHDLRRAAPGPAAGRAPRAAGRRPAPAAAGARSTPCHAGRKRGERALLGRLDLLAQGRERGAAQAAQHVGVAPLALAAAGAQLAAHQLARALERRAATRRRVDAVALAQTSRGGERAVRARVAAQRAARAAPRPSSRNASGSPPGGTAPSASR